MQSSLWSRYGTKRRWPSWRRGVGNEPINSADDGFRLISHVSRGLRGLWLGLPQRRSRRVMRPLPIRTAPIHTGCTALTWAAAAVGSRRGSRYCQSAPSRDLRSLASALPGSPVRLTVRRARLAPAMISTPGHRASRRRQRGALPAWSLSALAGRCPAIPHPAGRRYT